ncbi:pyridoxamine 5'-phosphate oxidase family protein [Aneurinibacillus aneurinilyticus]|jgi:PPOX class probable FMN-dependent enzyme|uniref:pyridoxamine 5'-phosphate oxidase family protein n=1 Tax=Aneurinibacillus aneurinilyticus TaxID=1391 RepID=UPI0023F6D9D8|nr:pyridoxamine 5'-phosphate oxidase family protein [Aneurinibacillus aneurinilyticus]MCI1693451.1 pyridoxamine 5'-phosphate oxidase family protein [Aneurinibacillus aneurinilyticus]
MFRETVSTEEELRSIIGYPSELVQKKAITSLDEHCRNFISKSPFLVMSTSDNQGMCDVSPRGDSPGFVLVLNEKHLVIPERPGNRRIDSMRNILSNPRVGLIFIIPGLEETLRVNGHACLVRDENLLNQMKANGRSPLIGIGIEVNECYVHCAKAFKRSELWNQNSWLDKEKLPNASKMLADHAKMATETVVEVLKESYTKRLY